MYYIGIDISKFKHDCAVIDDAGDVVTPSWSFANDLEGFLQFKALLDSLGTETKIGLESTGKENIWHGIPKGWSWKIVRSLGHSRFVIARG